MKKNLNRILLGILAILVGVGIYYAFYCNQKSEPQHEPWTQELIDSLDNNPTAKQLLVKAIDIAKTINPDHETNPAQTLDEYYAYLDWSAKCLPWSVIPQPVGRTLYDKIDQSVDYFYFILDIPLDELRDSDGLYYPTLQYIEPFRSWFPKYHDGWAKFLDSEESWKPEYRDVVLTDPMFGLKNGWYASLEDAVAETKEFIDGDTTHLQASQQGGDLFVGVFTMCDTYQDGLHLLAGELFVIQELS